VWHVCVTCVCDMCVWHVCVTYEWIMWHTWMNHIAHMKATHCNTLQHTATHCNTLQHTAHTWMNHIAHSRHQAKFKVDQTHGKEAQAQTILHHKESEIHKLLEGKVVPWSNVQGSFHWIYRALLIGTRVISWRIFERAKLCRFVKRG